MKPTHYYCDFQSGTQTKNKLQNEFYDFLKGFDHRIYKVEDIVKLQEVVQNKVKELNAKHSRCKPLNASLDNSYLYNNDYSVWTDFAILKFKAGNIHEV